MKPKKSFLFYHFTFFFLDFYIQFFARRVFFFLIFVMHKVRKVFGSNIWTLSCRWMHISISTAISFIFCLDKPHSGARMQIQPRFVSLRFFDLSSNSIMSNRGCLLLRLFFLLLARSPLPLPLSSPPFYFLLYYLRLFFLSAHGTRKRYSAFRVSIRLSLKCIYR